MHGFKIVSKGTLAFGGNGDTRRRRLEIVALVLLSVCGAGPAAAGTERDAALKLMVTSLTCPVAVETSTDGYGLKHVVRTKNRYFGNDENFLLREEQTDMHGSVGGEWYEVPGYNEVAFDFKNIASVEAKGVKAVVECKAGSKCIAVTYVTDADKPSEKEAGGYCFEEGMCRSETHRLKTSYRLSTCSAGASKDIKDAVEFLSGSKP